MPRFPKFPQSDASRARRPIRRAAVFALAAAALTFVAHRSLSSTEGAVPPAAAPVRLSQPTYDYTFDYALAPGEARPKSVAVAGDFNGWSSDRTPLAWTGQAFRGTVSLTEGVHHYKFVLDGNKWLPDPHGDPGLQISDGFGGSNSGALVGPDGRKLPAPRPDAIDADALHHDPADVHDLDVVDPAHVRLGLRCQADDVRSANVLVRAGGGGRWSRVPLYKMQSYVGFDRLDGLVSLPAGTTTFDYAFELIDGTARVYYAGGKAFADEASAEAAPYAAAARTPFPTPDWAKNAVWYQIFPERFRNGEASNDPEGTQRWTSDWWSKLPGESGDSLYKYVFQRRYGGDLQGIRQELPYLRSLGINAIYLNPIFKAESLHKYDASDYRHIDDHFGFKGDIDELKGETDDPATWQWTKTDRLFLDFLADAHRQGFKVIVDGVFNHTGTEHYAFRDVVKNGKASRYADWYKITNWNPLHWSGWGGDPDGALPEFQKDDKLGIVHGPRELLMGITRRWLAPDGDPSKGVDGFRLDAAENVPPPFWVDWRKLVKSIKPDAYLDGEIWSVAPDWLSGDRFDATMDYPFTEAMESFFVDRQSATSPSQFGHALENLFMAYPMQVMLVEQNLLDSHDTDRWASRFVNPDLPFNAKSRLQDTNPQYDKSKPGAEAWKRLKQSLVVQFTYAGAPMIYYGDETGMWGPSDPSDRMPMVWKDLGKFDDPQIEFRQDVFDQYQRLIAVRAARPELRLGVARTVLADDERNVFAFGRDLDAHHAVVVVNRSDTAQTVNISFGPADRSVALTSWLDPAAPLSSGGDRVDGRPSIAARPTGLKAEHGTARVPLAPWGAAVLTADWD